MARTNLKGTQVLDGTIGRSDLNITVSGSAVITKIIGSNGLAITSSSGADSGTGDVTLAADLAYLNGKYPSLEVGRTQNYVFAAPSSGSGNPAFRALVAGDIPAIPISGVTGLQTALDARIMGGGASGYLPKYTGSLALGNSILYESGGNIGIGTTNAVSRLTLGSFRNTTEETVGINFHESSTAGTLPAYGIGMGPAATEGYLTYRAGEGNTGLFGHKFFVNNVEVMRVRGDGNLGIGTASPAFKLDIAGDVRLNGGSNLRLYRSNNTTHGLNLSSGTSNNFITAVNGGLILTSPVSMTFDSASGHIFRDGTGTNTLMSITSSGELGVGPGVPRSRAHIFGATSGINGMELGSATGVSMIVSNNNPVYGLHFGVYSNGMSWMQAARTDGTTTTYSLSLQAAGGNVGIGTTTPAYKLDVSGTGNFSGNVTFAGNIGIGTAPVSYNSLRIFKAISGAVTSFGILNGGVVQSDVISQAVYNYTQLNTQASAFTVNNAILYSAGQGTIGEGSNVSNLFGYHVESTLTAGTNNYAFYSAINANAGRWNIYMAGTANNYMAGSLWIGTASSSYKLDVNGTGHFSGNVTFDANVSIATTPSALNHAVNKAYADLKLVAPTTGPTTGQYLKFDGTNNVWNNIPISDITGLQTILDAKISGSGTANYIPKYSGTVTLGVSQLFDNGTNIGIGTASPAFKLDIAGDIRINGGANLRLYRSDGTTHGLNLSSGTSNNFVTAATGGLILTSATSMAFDSASSHVFRDGTGVNTFMSINASGNIGVGTASPATKLELWSQSTLSSVIIRSVAGSISENAGIYFQQGRGTIGWDGNYGGLRIGVSDSGKPIIFVNNITAGGGEIARLTGAGNLGLGTNNPVYKLDVNGNARFSSNLLIQGTIADGNTIAFFDNNNTTTDQSFGLLVDAGTSANDYVLRLRNAATGELFRVTGVGNVGVNNSSPSYKLDVNGTGHFTGNVTFDTNVIIATAPTSGNHAVNKTYADLKLLAPVSGPTSGQFIKYNGTANIWATIGISDVTGLQTALDAKTSGSGVSGYLPKYTGNLTVGNSIIYESNGNIGISTTNAVSRLTFGSFRTLDTETVGINLHQALTAGGLPAYGIGMGPAATEGYLTFRAGEANTALFGHKFFVNNVEVMRVRGDGRLGIGTSSPSYLLDVAGTGRFSGNVIFDANAIIATAPTSGSHAVNKTYVDSLAFIKRGDSVKTISLSNITLSGTQTINAVTVVSGDLVLVTGQNTGSENGVYVVASGAWSRSTTNDSDLEIRGAYHYITSGTYVNQRYINTNASTITVGTTPITYAIDFGAETDPVWNAFKTANSIDSTAVSNWNIAFTNRISTKNTGDLIEGSNLYFTNTRVLATALSGLMTGSNTAITSSDTVLIAFQNLQAQLNNRLSIGGNYSGASITVGTNDNYDFNLERNNAVQMAIKYGVIEANFDFDVKGKLKINGSTGTTGQFVKYNGTTTVWSGLSTADLSDNADLLRLTTINGERGFQLFSTDPNYANAFVWSNDDTGIALGLHGYAYDGSVNKEFGIQLDTNGLLYHKKLDGSRSQIATVDMVSGGGNINIDGSVLSVGLNYKSAATTESKAIFSHSGATNLIGQIYMGSSAWPGNVGWCWNIVASGETKMNVGSLGGGLSLFGTFVRINSAFLNFPATAGSLSGQRCVLRLTETGSGYNLTLEQE